MGPFVVFDSFADMMRALFDKLRKQFGPSGDKPAQPVWTPKAPHRGDERSEESTREHEGPKQPLGCFGSILSGAPIFSNGYAALAFGRIAAVPILCLCGDHFRHRK